MVILFGVVQPLRDGVDGAFDVESLEHFAEDGMIHLADVIDGLGLRVFDPYAVIVEESMRTDVHVFVDTGAEDRSRAVPVEVRHVGAAANEADPKWSPGDYHWVIPELRRIASCLVQL